MAAEATVTVYDHKIAFEAYPARAVDIQTWTSTETRTEGGGGYIHPRYGGYIHAPTTSSTTTHNLRVRLKWADGRQDSVDLPGSVQLSFNDEVSFVAASNANSRKWMWAGVANVTTNRYYPVGQMQSVAPFRATDRTQHIGTLFFALLVNGGMAAALVGTGILLLLASLGISSALEAIFNGHRACHVDYYTSCEFDAAHYLRVSVMIVVAVAVVGIFRATAAANAASAAFDKARNAALAEALRSGHASGASE